MDWKLHTLRNAKRHETTQSHLISVEGRLRLEREIRAASSADTCPEDQPEAGPSMVQDSLPILQDLLTDMSNDKSQDIEFSGTFEDTGGLPMGEGKAQLAEALLGFLDDGSYSDNQSEWSEGQREHFAFEEEMIFDGEVDDNDENSRHSKRVRLDDLETPEASKEWFPWPDKIACTIDILMHLPRSVFSQRQLDILLWLLHVNGIHDLPSPRAMKKIEAAMQEAHGVRTIPYDGALGHKYYVNSLADMIAQVCLAQYVLLVFELCVGNGESTCSSLPAVLSRGCW